MKSSDKIARVIYIVVIVIVVITLYKQYGEDKKLKKDHFVVCATITSINYSKGSLFVDCYFYYNNKLINADGMCKQITKDKYDNGCKNILIAVQKDDCYIYSLLEDADDFFKYNITEKDTLGINCCNGD